MMNDRYFLNDTALQHAWSMFMESHQLRARWQALPEDKPSHFVIAETGFGRGLHFLWTWIIWQQYAPPLARLHYISSEAQPLTADDLTRGLALWPTLNPQAAALLTAYPTLTPGFHRLQFDEGRVNLIVMLGDALACYRELLVCGDVTLECELRDWHVDAWFLGGAEFTHGVPPWRDELLITISMLSKKNTTLTLYPIVDDMKRSLQSVGFQIQEQADPSEQGDMLMASFVHSPNRRTRRTTPWHAPVPQRMNNKRAVVLGAGLAGCYTAHALARRGWRVTLFDGEAQVGRGASGNQHAVLYPKLSSHQSPLNRFMLSAFLFASSVYKDFLTKQPMGELAGMLQLPYNQREAVAQASLQTWLTQYPALGRWVDAAEASCLAGITLQSGGLFIPHSGWLDSQLLCQFLVKTPGITWVPGVHATALAYDDGAWHVDGQHRADVLVLANGYAAGQFAQTAYFPLTAVQGQMTAIAGNAQSAPLRIPLCGDAHILPMHLGIHGLGATYNPGLMDRRCDAGDDAYNLAKLAALPVEPVWSNAIVGHWAGVRGATPDYLPLVGPVANADLFKRQFAGLALDAKRWIPMPGANYPGLYVCAGFGSRGLTSIPLSAECLAAMINQEPTGLPRTMLQSLSPARFLRRGIIRGQ